MYRTGITIPTKPKSVLGLFDGCLTSIKSDRYFIFIHITGTYRLAINWIYKMLRWNEHLYLYENVVDTNTVVVFFKETKSDFKTISFKKNQKIPRRNSKYKLQNMVKRKMTRTKLEIFC